MSKTVDERVVSMEFDNSKFESNVKTSMSTLDRLKKALNFDGVGKGFANIDKAASNVNMGGLANAADKVSLRFNAMQVAAVTAMTRITNKAIDTGERLVKSLSTDQIEAGWNKYNEKTASVQTMVNATGKSVTEINKYLNKLMRFSDETSFSFTEMTSALGNMLSSGGDIEKLIPMIEGIAGATAYAGKSGAEFVHVIRNINQSYSAGYLNLLDWKSVQNMNVNSKALMQTLIDVAIQQKKIKEGEVTLANFTDSLKDKWADTEVMEVAFGKFSAIIQDAIQLVDSGKFQGTVSEAIDELAKNTEKYDSISVAAAKASQNTKSFTEAIDATKDAVSSGWMSAFEKLFGNYDQAVQFWSEVTEILYELFMPGLNKINDLLDEAMTSKWEKIINKVTDAGVSIEKFENIVKKNAKKYNKDIDSIIKEEGSLQRAFDKGLIKKEAVTDSLKELSEATKEYTKSAEVNTDKLKYFQKVVDEVWFGTWDNGRARVEKLTAAGYDYNKVQELVNKTVDGHRLTLKDLNEEELKAIGYTEKEVKAIKALADEASKAGTDLNTLINALEKPTGRELFTDAILTFLQGVKNIMGQVATAWSAIFGETSSDQVYTLAENLNNAAHSFEEFTQITSDKGSKIQRVLKGVFAIFDIIDNTVGYGLVNSIRTLCKYLGMPIDDMLTMTASLGDLAVKANDWIWAWRKNSKFLKAFDTFWNKTFFEMVGSVREWIKSLWEAKKIQPILSKIEDFLLTFSGGILNYVKGGAKAIGEFVSYLLNLKNFDFSLDSILNVFKVFRDKVIGYFFNLKNISIEDYIKRAITGINSFIDRLRNLDGFSLSNIWITILDFFENVLSKIFNLGDGTKKVSTYFANVKDSISNFVNTCDNKISGFWGTLKNFYAWLKPKFAWLDGFSFGEVLTIGLGVGTIKLMKSIRLGIDGITAAFKDLMTIRQAITGVFSSMSSGIRNIADAFVKKIKVGTFEKKTKAILNLSFAIGILAASVAVLAWIPPDKLWNAVGAIAALGVVLSLLMLVAGKVTKISKLGVDLNGAGVGLLSLVAALIILTRAVKIISKIDTKNAAISAAIVTGLIIVLIGCAKILSSGTGKLAEGGILLLEMAGSMLILAHALNVIASIRSDKIEDAILAILGLMAILVGSSWAMSLTGAASAGALIGIVASLLLLAYAFKIIAKLDMGKVMDNIKAIALVMGSLIAIMSFSDLTKNVTGKSGLGIMGMAASLLFIAMAIKILGKIPTNELWKGVAAVGALLVVMGIVTALTKFAGQYAAKAGVALLAMGAAIMMLVIPIAILSQIKAEKLWKAVGAISVLMVLMGALMVASAFTGNASYKGLIGIAVAVGVMAVALGALAMIKPERLEAATMALGMLMAMFALMEAASYLTKGASIKVVLIMGAILAELVGVFYIMNELKTDGMLEKATALSLVMLSLTAVVSVLGTFGKVLNGGINAGIMAFTKVVGALVIIFEVLGSVFEVLDTLGLDATGKLEKGIDILVTICEGLGRAFGALFGGALQQFSKSFITVGENIKKFWEEVQPFFSDLTGLNETQVSGAKAFAAILFALSDCSLNANDLKSLDGDTIKTYFSDIGTALYSALHDTEGFAGLTEDDKKLIALASEMFGMFSQIQTPSDNLWADLTSATLGLNEYAGQIKMAGQYLNEAFSEENFGSELFADDLIIQRVQRLCDIFNAFAGVTIPYSSLSFSTLSSFASNLNNAAPKLVEAFNSDNFGNEIFNNAYLPQRAQRIAETLTAFAGITIPPSGLLDDTIKKFASNLNDSAGDIVGAAQAFTEANITEEQVISAQNAAAAISAFASIDSSNLNTNSLVSFINALNGTYAEGGNGLLNKLVEQMDNMKSIGDAKETVTTASDAIKALINSCNSVDNVNCTNLAGFANCIPNIGTSFSDFCAKVGGIETTSITNAMNNCDAIIDKVKTMNALDSSGAKGLGETLKKLAKDGIDGFIKKFSDSKTDTDSAVDTLVTNTASAAKSTTQKNKISNAFSELISKGVSTIRNKNGDFNSAGSYCVDGFVIGIDSNIYKVTAAGTRLGNAAYQAAKRAIDSNSPAKKFIELGDFSGQGFVIGMDNMRDKVASSGAGMANAALTSVRDSISRVSDIIQNGIDSQPTIRPIVDLSEAKLGARALSSMFNADTSVGLANQISRNRRSRVQTTNDDVVSAIKELGSNQGNNGNTYNINGITYDDGSNVADAVRTLIRAARVERRS